MSLWESAFKETWNSAPNTIWIKGAFGGAPILEDDSVWVDESGDAWVDENNDSWVDPTE